MKKLEDIKVWSLSLALGLEIYNVSKTFPKSEVFGLSSQIRRCAISISSNIAEGAGRNSNKDFSRFLSIASGSAYELQTQLIYCRELNYINKDKSNELLDTTDKIQKMIYRFIEALKNN